MKRHFATGASSSNSARNRRAPFELDPRTLGSRAPIGCDLLRVAFRLPCSHLLPKRLFLADPPIYTLPVQEGQFDFRPMEPASMFGCGVNLDQLANAPRARDAGVAHPGALIKQAVEVVPHQL
jgi:hypothetical protein